ncbi:hypothetical protein LTR95_012175 [Oleoguttula sp. CCFEE 5521]
MTQHYFSNGSRPTSSSSITLPPIRSVVPFPAHHVPSEPSPCYTTLSQQALAAAYPGSSRSQATAVGRIGQGGQGALSIRPAPYAASLSSTTGAQYNASLVSSTDSPTISECDSQSWTPLSSHHSSPEMRASVPAKRGSQDDRSSGTLKKRSSSDDERCSAVPCTGESSCARHRKIRNEKGSRGKQQEVHWNAEDFMEIFLKWQAAKVQANGNRLKSGLDRDKQGNLDAMYIFLETFVMVFRQEYPEKFEEVRLMAIERIATHAERNPHGSALPEGSPMAGPDGLANVCPNADEKGECSCADHIQCRKQRRSRGAQLTDEHRARYKHSSTLVDRTAPSSRTPTGPSIRTPASSSSVPRRRSKM